MRSYPVKENPISLAVSEILRYKQTDRQRNKQTDIVLLCIIDTLLFTEGGDNGLQIILFFYVIYKYDLLLANEQVGDFNLILIGQYTITIFKNFHQQFLSTEVVILFIIIWDIHKFFVICPSRSMTILKSIGSKAFL